MIAKWFAWSVPQLFHHINSGMDVPFLISFNVFSLPSLFYKEIEANGRSLSDCPCFRLSVCGSTINFKHTDEFL